MIIVFASPSGYFLSLIKQVKCDQNHFGASLFVWLCISLSEGLLRFASILAMARADFAISASFACILKYG